MGTLHSVVVVGAGLAGARAVSTLRAEGFAGAVTLVGAEPHLPYERPPLSKSYLQGASTRESAFVHEAAWYAEHDVDVLAATRVVAVDPGAREAVLGDGRTLAWDAMLLATGSAPRALGVPGEELTGVLRLRTLDESDRLREALAAASASASASASAESGRLVIVGAGWIGLEVAAAARLAGVAVTVLERAELPLLSVLGPELAKVFADLHRDHGVDLRFGVEVAEIVGTDGSVTGVTLRDGSLVPADVVLVAVGAAPDLSLARAAGLEVGTGVLVDAGLRASVSGIFAAGDLAEAFHPLLGRHVRVEHWDNAREQGTAAARSILGHDVAYDRLPYFYTDQYDLGMEYTGHVRPGGYDEVVLRGDVPGRTFVALWMGGGRVLAGMGVNVWDAMDPVRELITSGRQPDPARLRDPDVPLADL